MFKYICSQHNLHGWKCIIDYSNIDTWIGLSDLDNKIIFLKLDYLKMVSDYEIEQLICHEVAHALTEDEMEMHGPKWCAKAHEMNIDKSDIARFETRNNEHIEPSYSGWFLD